jgi:hypothetical protein
MYMAEGAHWGTAEVLAMLVNVNSDGKHEPLTPHDFPLFDARTRESAPEISVADFANMVIR